MLLADLTTPADTVTTVLFVLLIICAVVWLVRSFQR